MDKIADFLIFIMNQIGYAVCHQLPERTFVFQGRHLPVCARDTGLFLGIALCLVVLFITFRKGKVLSPSAWKIVALALFPVPLIVDVLTTYTGLRTTTNDIRLLTGALAGTGIAALIFPLVSSALYRNGGERRMFRTWWPIVLLLLIPAAVFAVVKVQWSGAYWLWSLLLTASVVFTFFVLSCTLLSLIREWRRGSGIGLNRAVLLWAGFLTVAELVLFNRMHWLLYRL